jgi:hypothetical protein
LIVMPNGFGFFWKGHPVAKEYALLSKVPIAPGPTGLIEAARAAVVKLAAARGVRAEPAPAPHSTANRDRVLLIVATCVIMGAAFAVRWLLRRRRA